MKFILKTIVKIFILFFVLIIPIGLLVTFLSLAQRDIPLWNIGIRNVFRAAHVYTSPIIFLSYLLATLVTVSSLNKMLVRSVFLLHIPVLIVGGIIIGVFNFINQERGPLSLTDKDVRLGYRNFLKEDVFNDVDSKTIMVKQTEDNQRLLYLYDKTSNELFIMKNTKSAGEIVLPISIDSKRRIVTLSYVDKNKLQKMNIPFRNFSSHGGAVHNRILLFYLKHVKRAVNFLVTNYRKLPQPEKYMFLGTFLLSVVMISIPFTYALNDGGWGFSGMVGVIAIVIFLPFFYGAVIKILQSVNATPTFLGGYSYLFPTFLFCFCGIFIDIIVRIGGLRKST
jgi:hypothetical protein